MNFARAVQVFQLLRQGAWMLMLLALARSGLALVEVGTFESLRYLGSLLTIPLITALGQAFLRVRQDASEARRWTTYFVLVLLLSGLTAGGLMAFGSEALGAILLDVQDLPFGLPYGLFVLGVYAGTLVEQEAIADQNAPRLLGYAIGSYGLQIIGFALPLALGYGLDAAIWGLSSTVVYRVGWLAWRHFRTGVADLPPASERKLFWSQANSLSVYGAFAVLVVIVDHFLVGHWSTDSEANLALWRYGSQELPLVVGVVAGLNATALAERQRGSDFMLEGLLRRSRRSIKYLLGLACLIMVASPYIYGQLLSESLYPAHAICNTMLLVLPSRLVQTQPLMISGRSSAADADRGHRRERDQRRGESRAVAGVRVARHRDRDGGRVLVRAPGLRRTVASPGSSAAELRAAGLVVGHECAAAGVVFRFYGF